MVSLLFGSSRCMSLGSNPIPNLYFKLGFKIQCHLSSFHFLCLTKSANFEIISFNVHPLLGFGLKKPLVNCKPVYSTAINWNFIIVNWLINSKILPGMGFESTLTHRCYDTGNCKGERITLKLYWVETELWTTDRKFRAQHWK